MNEVTMLASLIKTQETKLNDFLKRLDNYKAPLDTSQLKELIDQYRILLNNAANIKPRINTGDIEATIVSAIDDAVCISRLSDLQNEVTRQTAAVNKNTSLLEIGFGKMFKWWIFVVTLLVLFYSR